MDRDLDLDITESLVKEMTAVAILGVLQVLQVLGFSKEEEEGFVTVACHLYKNLPPYEDPIEFAERVALAAWQWQPMFWRSKKGRQCRCWDAN